MDVDTVEGNLDKVLGDLRLYDLSIDLHGSRNIGIHQPSSNVDILTTRPLQGLLDELHQDPQNKFRPLSEVIQTGPPWFMPPKIQLQHVPTSIQLDVISRWSADIFVRDRDKVASICIEKDERVLPYLQLVLTWAKSRQDYFSVEEGYPSSYIFRLLALHFLMARVQGVVLPPLRAHHVALNAEHERYAAAKKVEKSMSPDDLATEFLEYLARCGKPDRGIWADLRNPMEPGPNGVWQVIDPTSHKKLLRLNSYQIGEIAKMAKLDSKGVSHKLKD
jgi:hypothetical protein